MTREPRRRGLLLDWGGVLTTNLFTSFGAFCADEGLEPATLARAFRDDEAARSALIDLECGRIEVDGFEPRLAEALGITNHEGLVARLFARVGPEETMLDAVRRLRASGVRTGLVSNSWGGASYDRSLFEELFDGIVISGDEGIRKPSTRMYELGLERIGLPAHEVVYVDDLAHNLDAPRELGIHVIHHTDAAATVAELDAIFGTP